MTEIRRIPEVTGVILAGGASSRFGTNKALALHGGTPLITHVARTLERIFDHLLLVTNQPDTYSVLNWPTTKDRYPGAGPLAGIHAALVSITTPRAFVVACDMPFLNEEMIRFLSGLAPSWDAVVPVTGRGLEPLHALYSTSALPTISASLEQRQHKLATVLSKLRVRLVPEEELRAMTPGPDPFTNINRPEDLAGLRPGENSAGERHQ